MAVVDYDSLFFEADNLRNSGQVDRAIQKYGEIAHMAEDDGLLQELGRALHGAGLASKQGSSDSKSSYLRDSLLYFQKAAEVYRQGDYMTRLGALYRDAASSYYLANQDQKALENFQKSVAILSQNSEYGELGCTYDKIGNFYNEREDLPAAERYYEKALETFKKDPTAGFYLATTLYDFALLHAKQGNFAQSQELLEQSLGWFSADHEGERYDQRLAELYGTLAAVADRLGEARQAKAYEETYIKYLKNLEPRVELAVQKKLERRLG